MAELPASPSPLPDPGQLEAKVGAWKRRIKAFNREIETEPARGRALYNVRSRRIEPMGLLNLWPETN